MRFLSPIIHHQVRSSQKQGYTNINILIIRWLPICRETRHMGIWSFYSFPKNNQHADYRLVNPHGAVKHSAWVPRSVYSFPKNNKHSDYRTVNPHNTIKQRTWVPKAFTLPKNNQHPNYRTFYPYALKQGAWVSAAFTPEFSQVCAIRPERAEAPSPGHRPG